MLWLICVVTVLSKVTGQQTPPCKNPMLTYVEHKGEKVGSIRLADPGGTVALDVLLYTASQLSSTQNGRAGVSYFTPTRPSKTLRFLVRLPSQNPLSQVGRITVNGRVSCESAAPQGARTLSTSVYSLALQRQGYRVNTATRLATQTQSSRMVSLPTTQPSAAPNTDEGVCGIPVIPKGLLFGGNETNRGDWPWIAALLLRDMRFTCGTTVISRRHVLTAAHCMFHPDTDQQLKTSEIVVGVGKYNLSKWDERNVQYSQVQRITIHEEFIKQKFRNDIAILRLDEDITYTVYVRPICLWAMDTDLGQIVGRDATVVGWGLTEAFQINDTPLQTQIPIVSQQTCRDSHPSFIENMDPKRSFCAGTRMGVGPCKGDSGSGLVIQAPDKASRVRWFLRGVVSYNAPGNRSKCHLDGFSVFTDAAKFKTWIESSMNLT